MLVIVLRPFLNGNTIVEPHQTIDVSLTRARDLERLGLVIPELGAGSAPPAWWPNWRGDTCVLVASGPSAHDESLEPYQGRARFFAVNESWRLAPWADALYGNDFAWWERHKGVPEFGGLKFCQDSKIEHRPHWHVRLVNVAKGQDRLLVGAYGRIGWGGNSGFGAFNLAVQFGASRIVLVGFDMRIDRGLHWHGAHTGGLNNPAQTNVDRWRRVFDEVAPIAAALGIEVVNASAHSALRNYRKMSLAEALCPTTSTPLNSLTTTELAECGSSPASAWS